VLGRVMSVLMFASIGLMPVSLAVAGVALKWSLPGMFAVAGALVLVVTTLRGPASAGARNRLTTATTLLTAHPTTILFVLERLMSQTPEKSEKHQTHEHRSTAVSDSPTCWPALPPDAWQDTRETLHMWTQIVGKV